MAQTLERVLPFSKNLLEFDLPDLANYLKIERDRLFDYMGIFTLKKRFFVKTKDKKVVIESPQGFWMRVAMGLAINEKDKNSLSMFSSFIALSISKAQNDVVKLQRLNEELENANKRLEKKIEREVLDNKYKSSIIFHQSKMSSMG